MQDESIKILYAKVAAERLDIRQFYVVTAYMNAAIKGRKVYMKLPSGFTDRHPGKVAVLLRALYGLRQAGYLWQEVFTITTALKEIGFKPLMTDPCVVVSDWPNSTCTGVSKALDPISRHKKSP